jgi:hypothetical protein
MSKTQMNEPQMNKTQMNKTQMNKTQMSISTDNSNDLGLMQLMINRTIKPPTV